MVKKFSAKISFELRSHLANGLISLGNAAAVALFFGQIFNKQNFSWISGASGIFLLIFCYLFAIFLMKGASSK